jgi:hypothetical protein
MRGTVSLLRRNSPGILPARRNAGRFWFESVFAVVSAILSVVTLVLPDWIEAVFNVDPDHHSGTLEWAIAAALLAAAVAAGALARRESRRPLVEAPVVPRPR